MAFFIVKRDPKNPGTLKLILGRNVAKKATERNLLKRRVRVVVQPFIGKSEAGFVIIVKPGAVRLTYGELEKELVQTIKTKK